MTIPVARFHEFCRRDLVPAIGHQTPEYPLNRHWLPVERNLLPADQRRNRLGIRPPESDRSTGLRREDHLDNRLCLHRKQRPEASLVLTPARSNISRYSVMRTSSNHSASRENPNRQIPYSNVQPSINVVDCCKTTQLKGRIRGNRKQNLAMGNGNSEAN